MSERPNVSPETYDRWFEVLADDRRRRLLFELSRRLPPPVSVSVPDDIVAPDEDPDSVHLRLRHIHLPMLAQEEIVDWNREEGTVSTGSSFEAMLPLLRTVERFDDRE